MKILVTGATGFLGANLISWLVKNTNHEIIASSRNLKKSRNFDWITEVKFVEFDMENAKNADILNFYSPDILVHYAWTNYREINSPHHILENLPNSFDFVRTLVKQGIKNIVVIGSGFEYGMINGSLNENINTNPVSFYAIAKDTLRKTLNIYLENKGVIYKWIRVFNVFGDGIHPKSLFGLLENAIKNGKKSFPMSGGEQIRDYIEVGKLSEYTGKIILQNKINGIINCCSGSPITVKKLTKNIISKKKSDIKMDLGIYPYSPIEPMEYWGDTEKLKMILNQG